MWFKPGISEAKKRSAIIKLSVEIRDNDYFGITVLLKRRHNLVWIYLEPSLLLAGVDAESILRRADLLTGTILRILDLKFTIISYWHSRLQPSIQGPDAREVLWALVANVFSCCECLFPCCKCLFLAANVFFLLQVSFSCCKNVFFLLQMSFPCCKWIFPVANVSKNCAASLCECVCSTRSKPNFGGEFGQKAAQQRNKNGKMPGPLSRVKPPKMSIKREKSVWWPWLALVRCGGHAVGCTGFGLAVMAAALCAQMCW